MLTHNYLLTASSLSCQFLSLLLSWPVFWFWKAFSMAPLSELTKLSKAWICREKIKSWISWFCLLKPASNIDKKWQPGMVLGQKFNEICPKHWQKVIYYFLGWKLKIVLHRDSTLSKMYFTWICSWIHNYRSVR